MKHKHLTYDDRLIIQQELENNYSLHKIAQRLHKSDSTIAREIIQPHRTLRPRECLRNGKPVHR